MAFGTKEWPMRGGAPRRMKIGLFSREGRVVSDWREHNYRFFPEMGPGCGHNRS
ncbi:hypothetical protein [Candidatus Hakubella thermalkaliphila]|uniref:hypothetical protein n=1 Tax=Candidatus Hakubella thermalkaliphila TaxID=2754717 RepID=UPI001594008D|nr:hypothetical protein [Candidatus Hakubella thermalkaliphila]